MAKEFSRAQRIGDQIQRELAQLIRMEVKDPRLGGLVTITAVDVSRDSSHAKVYVTVMGGEPEDGVDSVAQSIKVLNDASGFLRMQLGRAMKLRSVPNLRFHYDESVVRGAQLSALIERAVSEDRLHDDAPTEAKE
ncbi:30S ribosome-binding factor RbfA [Pseudomonas sp. HMWF032]|uniref:30S ribosome-binding factor RbfA n=1 Tax=unclassified Pseudomonas TaxID=196821 RepID=UPI000D3BF5AA|nr:MULTISPECIES: 30S ribosome-binding factor RbfA [unclassified Pseudomonas]PTS83066.1 30S ribosome-binding factor RbfA [Pseudomonas sp. HMWF032]PTT85915.1 30S ribosome-binding factor RbfA [Pseudomonas sp. HMWF010]WAC45118.1 30S ribosome-binding factor RbfA [Pseudomonas sp. SL4(2022)]